MRNLPVLVAFVATACPITASHAESTDGRRSETVQFGDLNLNNQQGAITLYRRLHNAATDVCTELSVSTDLSAAPRYKRCVEQALSDAVAAVDQPAVTAYAQARGVSITPGVSARPN
jgi:UrcA family protein